MKLSYNMVSNITVSDKRKIIKHYSSQVFNKVNRLLVEWSIGTQIAATIDMEGKQSVVCASFHSTACTDQGQISVILLSPFLLF